VAFFAAVPEYDVELYTHKKSKTDPEISLAVLKGVLPLLADIKTFNNDNLFQMLKQFGKENDYKTGTVMWPIRTALSGVPTTPGGATALAEILGREESLRRVEAGIAKLEAAV
jgi:glutamyl-tRNA synthetase